MVMVCSMEWVASLLQSVSYVGSLIGYMIMSHIADNYGRKKGEYLSWAICIAGQVITLCSVNIFMVGVGSFFMGFGANGAITIHYSFFKELVLGKTRERMIIAIQLAFSIGISIISLLSYLINQWKYTLGFFITVPSLLAFLIFKYVEETPEFTLKAGI
jgi:MFS family permease